MVIFLYYNATIIVLPLLKLIKGVNSDHTILSWYKLTIIHIVCGVEGNSPIQGGTSGKQNFNAFGVEPDATKFDVIYTIEKGVL